MRRAATLRTLSQTKTHPTRTATRGADGDRPTARGTQVYASAVARLRQRLVSGEWPPGARLPAERALAAEFGLSRPIVREALRSLERTGLVEIRPNVGVFHRELAATTAAQALGLSGEPNSRIADCIEARLIIECGSLRLVAERISDVDLSYLGWMLERSRAASDNAVALELDRQFHVELHSFSGNAIMRQAVENSFDLLWEQLPTILELPRRRQTSHSHHRAILDGLAARDPDTAVAAMKDHLDTLRRNLLGFTSSRAPVRRPTV